MARATFTLLALFGYFVQSQATVQEWLQCGGIGYSGDTFCDVGLMCQVWNPYYSQCIPSTSTSTTMPHTTSTSTSTKKTSSTKTSSTKKSSSTKTSSTKISSSTKMSSSSTKKTSSTSTSIKTSSSSKPSSASTTSTTPTSTSHSTPSTSVPSSTSSSTVTSLSSTPSPTSNTTTSSTLPTSTSFSTVISSSSTPSPTSTTTTTTTTTTSSTLPTTSASTSSTSVISSTSSSTVTSSSSTSTPPPTSTSTATSTSSTYTGTLPIIPESPTGLAQLAKPYGKYIGSAYDYPYVSDKNYTAIVLANVDQFTCENSMKWDSIEQSEGDFSTSYYADNVVEISQLNGMTMRGHCLVWYSQLPTWVTSGNWTNATLTEVMINHITGEMSLYKGEIFTWDVVNEALNDDGTMRQSIFYDTIGETFIDIAFNTAKSVDPKPILAINDYNIEGAGAKATAMINLVTRVKARGAPIEQIGIQGHLIVGSLPGNMVALWNQYVALGVSVAITELDIRMTLPATDALLSQQATDYVHMVTVCLDVPQCLGITFWGLSDMYSWVPATFSGQGGADLFDANMQPKPAYTALQALLGGTSTSSASPTSSTSTISSTTTPPPSSTASSTTSTQTYTGTLPIYPESPTGLATLAKAYGKYIGSAYDYPYVSDKNYTDIVLANVDQFTCENSMKWDSIEQTEGDFSTSFYADKVVQISQLNGMTMRGHCLVWYSQLPTWVTSGNWTNATLTEVMINHITGEMSLYKGEIFTWDVVNEALNDDGTMRQSIFYDTIGETFIDIAFNTAKSIDSKPILAINDYNIEGAGAKATGMINLVTRVKARGAPIEQIGIQGHLIVGSLPGNMVALWNQYVALGVSVAITELDIRMTLPATDALLSQQATDYVHMVTVCLDVPQCLGITFWGLSDMYSWVPATFSGQGGADLFDANMQPKPAYTALQALLGGTSTSSASPTSSTSTISSTTTPPPSSTASSTTSTQTYTGTLPIYPESPTGLATLAKAYGKYIGSAYDYPYVSDKNYTDIVLANVDQFTCENSMKWDSIEQTEGDFSTSFYADNVVQISQLNGMTMRGHCLVWYSQLPNWVTSGNWTNATLTEVMINHITGEMSLYKGEIFTWDVVNEALNDDGTMRSTIFYDTIGETFIDIAFNTAKSVDPKPILAINDYNIEGAGAKATAMINLVTRVKARGAPIEQIGIQGHLIVGSLPGNIVALWNQYVALGVSVALTELDIRMTLPATDALLAQQATDYVHMVTACLDVPQCLGITFWGLSDMYSWVPATFSGQGGADLFDSNMQPKPAYTALQALLGGGPTSSVSATSTTSSAPTSPPSSTTSSPTTTQTYTGTLPIYPESPTGLAILAKPYGKYIGSAYDYNYVSDKNYTDVVLANVDQFTCENSMKWDSIEQTEGDFSTSYYADNVVQISQLNGMTMRGHCLVWYSQLPNWVTSGNWTNATLTQVMINHIIGEMSLYKGEIFAWDVVNEALNDDGTMRSTIFYDTIGETFIDIAFNTAKSVDPKPILAINDYNIEGAGAKATAMIDLVTRVKARGAPIEQIGIQGHLIVGSLPGNMVALWNQYVALGVSVVLTELDIRMTLPATDALLAQQATDYVHMVTVCLDIPQCLGITFWGLSDLYSWVPATFSGQGGADLFDANMQPKPAYAAIQALLEGTSTSVTPTSTSVTPTSTMSSTATQPPTSTTASSTSTQTYTGTLPIDPESPTGLAVLAKSYGKYIGSAYDNAYISDKNYTSIVLGNVDQLTCENSMKWDSIEQTEGDFSTSLWADRVVQISQLNGMTMRGHCLVWYSQLPTWVTSGNWTNATMTQVMVNHITGVMSKYKGQIYIWDVVNEALNDDGTLRQSIFYNLIGETYIDIAFNTAKSVDPTPILAINDYNIEGAGAKATAMIDLVTRVKARGAPIEQIGIQGHLIVGSLPGNMVALWNQYVALGVSVAITELDIRMTLPTTDALLSQQATDYVHMVTVCLDVPQCLGITFWGLSDEYSWVPSTFSGQGAADLFDANMQPKPAYSAVQNLLETF